MKPPANESPAPVGSTTSSMGNAGARNGCEPMPNAPSRKKIVAPYSPCLMTNACGPMESTLRAARGRLLSPASIFASVSLISKTLISFKVSVSSLRLPRIQKFMVSPPVRRTRFIFQSDCRLQRRMNIAEKQVKRIQIFFGDAGLESFEEVQLGKVGFGLVQVIEVLSSPAERFSLGTLQAAGVHTTLGQDTLMAGCEIVAHHGHDAHISKIARCQRKVGGRPAQHVFHTTAGCGNGIECDRADG